MEQENWINEIFNSTNGLQQVAPDAGLFSKIQNSIYQARFVSPKTVWLAAASIALLIAINVALLSKMTRSNAENATSIAASFDKSNQLY